MADLRTYIAELKRMRAEDQRFLDELNSTAPVGVNRERRADSLRERNMATKVDDCVIQALEEIRRVQQITTRVERLRHFLGWMGNALAALALATTTFLFLAVLSHTDKISIAGVGIVATLAFLGIGRSFRYHVRGQVPSRSSRGLATEA
jgi:hypothetical protein